MLPIKYIYRRLPGLYGLNLLLPVLILQCTSYAFRMGKFDVIQTKNVTLY